MRLPPDGMLRLIPGHAFGTIGAPILASDLLRQKRVEPRLRGAIVLIGSSAPELGGLRPTPDDPLMPSIMILAMAVDQVLRGRLPLAMPHEYIISWVLALAATIAGLLAALLLRPVHGGPTARGCPVEDRQHVRDADTGVRRQLCEPADHHPDRKDRRHLRCNAIG